LSFLFIFSFKPSNPVTLTHLNALFGKLADLNQMGIGAGKLFKLILKTDLNNVKIEWYRRKLGISQNDNRSIDSDSEARMISRGPFIAIFKHESITFINSLENVARSLTGRRKKRKKRNFSPSVDNSTVHQTVKSAPAGSRQTKDIHDCNNTAHQRKSLKRKKIEDKTGMIIVAEVDHDEMSTVSISPTSACAQYTSASLIEGKPLSLIAGNCTYKSHGKIDRKDFNRTSSQKKARKNKKKRSSLRSIKSVGRSRDGHDEECDSLSSGSVFSNPTIHTFATVSSSEALEAHERSLSNIETINIREVLEENSVGACDAAFRYTAHAPYHSSLLPFGHPMIAIDASNPYHQHPLLAYDSSQGYAQHNHAMYSHLHHHSRASISHSNWQHDPYYQDTAQYDRGSNNDNIEYEECFLIRGFTSFLKKIFGIEKKQKLLIPKPDRNMHIFQKPTSNHNDTLQTQQKWHFDAPDAPARPRALSRVLCESDVNLSHQTDHETSESLSAFVKGFDSLQSKASIAQDENENYIDARLFTFQNEQDQESRASCNDQSVQVTQLLGTTQAMEAWKASAPCKHAISIADDFSLVGIKRLEPPNLSYHSGDDDAVHHDHAGQNNTAVRSDVKDVSSLSNADIVLLRKRTTSMGSSSSNRRRSIDDAVHHDHAGQNNTAVRSDVKDVSSLSNADIVPLRKRTTSMGSRSSNRRRSIDDAVHHDHAGQNNTAVRSDVKDVSSLSNADIAPLRKRTTSMGSRSSNRRRSISSSDRTISSSRSNIGGSSGFSVLKDASNSELKKGVLKRQRLKPLGGPARSKSDGGKLSKNTSIGNSTISSSSSSSSRPSMISRSTSAGSSSLQAQHHARTNNTGNAGGFFHYR